MTDQHPRQHKFWESWEDDAIRRTLTGDEVNRTEQLLRLLDELERPADEVERRIQLLFNVPGSN